MMRTCDHDWNISACVIWSLFSHDIAFMAFSGTIFDKEQEYAKHELPVAIVLFCFNCITRMAWWLVVQRDTRLTNAPHTQSSLPKL